MKNYLKQLQTNNRTRFISAILGVIAIKALLLAWSAHPFDFWSFTNTFQRSVLYGWDVFEFWNKGNFLIAIWYPIYSLYAWILETTQQSGDSLLLLHFLFKLPFLFFDLLSGYLLWRIATKKFGDSVANMIFWGWFINPIVFYVYGIHGHYDLLVPFSIILLIYGLLEKRSWMVAVAFVLMFTTKYFVVMLLPLILLYMVANKSYKLAGMSAFLSAIGIVLSYAHFFSNSKLIGQTFGSILSLSGSTSSDVIARVQMPSLNIFAAINFLMHPRLPLNNIDFPFLYSLAAWGMKIALLGVAGIFMIRLVRVIKLKRYDLESLILDVFVSLVVFLVFSTNFQPHYLSWFLPLILLMAVRKNLLFFSLIAFTFVGFVYQYKNELGPKTFFMDIVPVVYINYIENVSSSLFYGLGAIIVAVLIVMALQVILIPSESMRAERFSARTYLFVNAILWIILVIPYTQAILVYALSNDHFSLLSYARMNNISRGRIEAVYSQKSVEGDRIVFRDEENSNALFFDTYNKLSENGRDKFYARLVSSISLPGGSKLNGCMIGAEERVGAREKLLGGRKQYAVPMSCLQNGGNELVIPGEMKFKEKRDRVSLFIANREVPYAYGPQLTSVIGVLAGVGLVLEIGFVLMTFGLVRRLIAMQGKLVKETGN